MPFPPHLPAPILEFAAGVKSALDDFFRRVSEQITELRVRVLSVAGRLTDRLPQVRWRPVLFASVGVCAVLVLIFAGSSLLAGNREGRKPPAVEKAPVRQGLILSDELFLPEEPDFVPGVLLERERRTSWTVDDAVPLWQDPLKNGEEPWRNRIEKTIDEIMESVP